MSRAIRVTKEEIKNHPNMYKIYGTRLQRFHKEGHRYKALCPFHGDRNPSFDVYEENGEWKWGCFPCQAQGRTGGDVIEFVMQRDHLDFKTALQKIAKELGMRPDEPEEPEPKSEQPPLEFDPERAAARLPEIKEFLAKRGISLEVAQQYAVGADNIPGLGLSVILPYGDTGAAKIRSVTEHRFIQPPGTSSADKLYGVERLDWIKLLMDQGRAFIVESELDALTLISHGYNAVSVSSASSAGKINQKHLALLQQAERIFLCLDMDAPGQAATDALEKLLPPEKVFRLIWPFKKGASGLEGCKDIGELYAADPATFKERFDGLVAEALNRPPRWRTLFRSYAELSKGDIHFLIEDFLPEGITFIGATPGTGKTWLAVSIAKALVTGKRFMGIRNVPEPVNVIYLTPEVGERSLRSRLEKMKIKDNPRFLCRTVQQGIIDLDDPLLLQAVQELKPVIILDTAIRFLRGINENEAGAISKALSDKVLRFIEVGAQAVIGIHHSTKAAAREGVPTLESALRGSGDIGALCDAAYGLKCVDPDSLTIEVHCVKARDFEKSKMLTIVGRPNIDENGDFGVLVDACEDETKRVAAAIMKDANLSYREIARTTGVAKSRVAEVAARAGWKKEVGGWVNTQENQVPRLVM